MELAAIEGECFIKTNGGKIIMGINVYSRTFHLISIIYPVLDPL